MPKRDRVAYMREYRRARKRNGSESAETAARQEPGTLTAKQEAFCREYLEDRNAAAAYRRAGYSSSRANVGGAEMLRKATVRARIAELEVEAAERNEVSVDWVIQGLKGIAIRSERDADRRMAYRDIGEHIGMWPKRPAAEAEATAEEPRACMMGPEPCETEEEWHAYIAESLPKYERMRADPEYAERVKAEKEQEEREILEAARPYAKAGTSTVVEPTDGGRKWRVFWAGPQGSG